MHFVSPLVHLDILYTQNALPCMYIYVYSYKNVHMLSLDFLYALCLYIHI